VLAYGGLDQLRAAARTFEQNLPAQQRKLLGQYFTGLPLSRLLAHLALQPETRSVIDPMAGHGDLLDVTATTAFALGISLHKLDGIEVDPTTAAFCRERVGAVAAGRAPLAVQIESGDAFDSKRVSRFDPAGYDLVVGNPPYVRYQAQENGGPAHQKIKAELEAIARERLTAGEQRVWIELIRGYSGLADLSVPAWLLSAMLTKPNGTLALVVPATWRSRNYADVIRYLMLRFFDDVTIVGDAQPGWFPDALVRTHLVVARRRAPNDTGLALAAFERSGETRWIEIAPSAGGEGSLVGSAFPTKTSEADFAAWAASDRPTPADIAIRQTLHRDEVSLLHGLLSSKRWFRSVEAVHAKKSSAFIGGAVLPDGFRRLLGLHRPSKPMCFLASTGISVGQGLRTGCNRFFYVTRIDDDGQTARVRVSSALGGAILPVPLNALQPVLHRQADIASFARGRVPDTAVLELRQWALNEDRIENLACYHAAGVSAPAEMPRELADFVRHAASSALDPGAPDQKIPDLSAVRTNVRKAGKGNAIPRFWYMLPDFVERHRPTLIIPRVNQFTPIAVGNQEPPILIDANFSTLWADSSWSPLALEVLFASSWVRAALEIVGTPMGGGALKLEATQIRQVPIPILEAFDRTRLDEIGRLTDTTQRARAADLLILGKLFDCSETMIAGIAADLKHGLERLSISRQRSAA
jgi:hypothetical protein